MAFVGIKKLIKEDKEETKRNTSAIVAEQIKAGLLAGLGKRSYPEDWQDTTTGRVTTPKTTTTTETAPKNTAGTKTKKTVTGTPKGTENIARTISPATAPVSPLTQRFSQESVADRLRKSSNTVSAEDPWVNWLIENGHIDRSGSVQGKVTGPISKEAYRELEQNMSDYKARNRIAADTGTAFGNVQRNSPLAQYNSLKPEEKASFYRAGSDKMRDITSFAGAQQYVAGLDYNVSDAWQEMHKWDTTLKNHQKAGQEQNKRRQDLENMLPEGIIRQRLVHGAKVPFTETPDNYSDYSEDYDRQLYDFFYGKGEHDKIMKIGNRQQKEKLMDDLRELWRNVDNGTFAAYDQQNRQITDNLLKEERANMLAEYAEDQKKQAEHDYNTAKNYQAFRDIYREKYGTTSTPYTGEDLGRTSFSMNELERGVHTSDADRIFSFLTGGKEYQAYQSMYVNGKIPGNRTMQVTDEYNFAMLMSPEEQNEFKEAYINDGKKAAEAYMAGLHSTGVLRERYSEYEKIRAMEFGREFPGMAVAASLMNDAANTIITPFRTAAGFLGYEGASDPNDVSYKPAMTSEYLQQGFTENIRNKFGDTAAEAAGVALNTVQNVLRGLLTRGLGLADKAQEFASLALFGVDVFGKNTYKYLDKGYGLNESYLLGGVDSAIEILEEKIPTDVMLGGVGNSFWSNLRNSSLAELIQEGVGATAGEKAKGVLTGEDSERKRAVELFAEGMTDENGKKIYPAQMGQEGINLASGQARKEYLTEAGRSAIGGFAGGGLGAAYGGIVNTANNINLGRAINSGTNTVDGKTGAAQLAALAKESTDKEIREAGEKLDKKITGGKGNPSNYSVGKLAGMLYQGTADRMQTVVQDTMVRSIRDQIMTGAQEAATRAADAREAEQHEITQQEAQHYAEIIAKSILTGKNPTNAELQELSKSEDAIQAWKSFNTRERVADMAAEISKEAAPMNSVMDTLGDLTSKVAKSRSAAATDIDAAIREAKGDTAAAIDHLQARRSDLISESFAGKMKDILKADKGGKQSKNFLDDAVKIMLSAKTLAKTAPKTRLDSETAQKLFDAAREEFEAEDANRVIKQVTVKPGEGKASFEGVEYGTKEWKQKVSGLSKTQRNQMGALGEIATRAGLKVSFINDAARSMINGYENNDGSIVINIAARNRSGLGHHMLTTMSHEMTHWLEQNSREGYGALRQFIVDGLRKSGTDVESRILQIMNNQNTVLGEYEGAENVEGLSVNGAMAELVAQGCENLLSSETMMQELAEVNPGAFSKVKTFVTNFVARIRNAVKGMSGSLSYEARTLIGQTEQIAKLWSSARAEALARNAEEGAEAQAGTQYSTQAEALEQAQEMDTEEYRQIAEQAGLDAPQMLRYSMVGPRAGGDYAEMIRQARQMEKQGEDAETIFRETGARKGFRGHWWVTLDNQNIRMKENFDTDSLSQYAYDLADVMDAEELMAAYPQLGKVKVQAQEMGRAYAAYVKDHNTIVLNEEELKRNPGKMNVALRHEIQHVIQDIEGANGGVNISRWQDIISRNGLDADPLDLYWRTAGEMEANAASKDGGTMPTREQYERAVAIEDYAPGLKGWKSRMEGRLNRHFSMADISAQDQEYAEAVASGNMKKATEMLMEKLKHSEDIIPYSAPHGYGGQHKTIAKMIKEGTPEAVARAAQDLASYVPDNAVLIPMPPHEGTVMDDTDTMILARAIAQLTGRPVVNALASNPRESRYQAKSQGRKGLTAEEMGFRKIAELPEGTIPIFVDNVVGSGETAKAANLAMGGGVTLAYAKGTRTQGIRGLKEANVTYDKDGKLIPLSQRFNPDIRNVKYSTQDADYMAAVERGDMEEAQRMADEAAKEAGYTLEAFHGTGEYFNVFRRGYEGIHLGNREQAEQVAGLRYQHRSKESAYKWSYVRDGIESMNAEQRESLVRDAYLEQDYFEDGKAVPEFDGDISDARAVRDYAGSIYQREAAATGENPDDIEIRMKTFDRKTGENIMHLYAKINNPLVINGDIGQWDPASIAGVILRKSNGENAIIGHSYKEVDISGSEVTLNDEQRTQLERLNSMEIKGEEEQWDVLSDVLDQLGFDGIQYLNQYEGDKNSYSYIALRQSDVKSAEAVTYDDQGNVIPPSERFNSQNNDIRYSTQEAEITNSEGDVMAEELPGGSYTMYSLATWTDTDLDELEKELIETGAFRKKDIRKWIQDVNSIAAIIAADRDRLDYKAMPGSRMLKNNQEYIKTLDASTLCAKRLLYQGIYNEIQRIMPDTPLMPDDLINLINMMKRGGLVTPCGICYVESRRRMLGKYASEWLKNYDGEYKPRLKEVTTTDGLESLRAAPEGSPKRLAYESFVDAMNAKGSANPKVVQLRTDYKPREIRDMTANQIQKVKDIGGLRVQSFSDFEVPHLIDMMQAVMDMAAKGLTSQAYTKVPEFAWVFGNTGIKINLSLIGKGTGLDADGHLAFDDREGMPFADAMALREAYSKNVGTILVGMNDAHIIEAMGDDRIDFIIPFHKSGWGKKEMAQVIGMASYKDYTMHQNEKLIDYKYENRKGYKTIPNKKSKISNFNPVGKGGYWEFNHDGIWNAEKYLKKCADAKRIPKFANFLIDNGDGSFRLPTKQEALTDTTMAKIRKGYWKLLIDFKMYENQGKGAEQKTVKPEFNMDKAREILDKYDGNANTLPTNHAIAEQFVTEYKRNHPRTNIDYETARSYGYSGNDFTAASEQGARFSVQSPYDMDVNNFMMGLQETQLDTLQEKTMLRQYKDLKTSLDVQRLKIDERTKELRKLEAKTDPNAKDRNDMIRLRNMLDTDTKKRDRLEEQIVKVTSSEGYAGLMYRQHRVMMDLANGKTADDVKRTISGIQSSIEGLDRQISEREAEIREMAESTPVKAIQAMINDKDLDRLSAYLRKTYNSKTSKQEIMQDMAAIRLKMANRQKVDDDIEALTRKLIGGVRGEGSVYLDLLRGMTITLSRDQVKELAGKDSGIAEVRRMLAGSGIKVKQGKAGGSLDANWDELCDMIPALDRDTNEKDQIDELIRFVQSQLQSTSGADMYQDQLEDAMTEVRAITASVGMDMAQDPAAVRVVQRMMGLMAEMQRGMKGSAAELKKAREQLAEMSRQGAMAGRLSGDMEHNITSTIEYLNKLSEQSEAARWRKERVRLIEQLKSETTEKLLQEQAKWKARIEKDKTVRGMMNENMSLRKKIHTNVSRIQKLLVNETDLKNIPEHMKGLARLMVGKVLMADMSGGRKITGLDPLDMAEIMRVIQAQIEIDGQFDESDLDLVGDEQVKEEVAKALADIEDGISYYKAKGGKDIIANLQGMKNALTRLSEGVATITSIINSQRSVGFWDRRMAIEDAAFDVMQDNVNSRFKGELTGRGSKLIRGFIESVGYGNMTPVYFFKNLRNRGMTHHWQEMENAEHRNGLLLQKAKAFVQELAQRTHYKDWAEKTITVNIGKPMEMTVQQAMEILAIWKREQIEGPENSTHLSEGGFVLKTDENQKGKLRRERSSTMPVRIGAAEIAEIEGKLTDEQKQYMEAMVGYLSNEMSELGNEASMRMYGIKKYKEKYYFPMATWEGQTNARSDRGSTIGVDENRAAHKSWSKRRKNGAKSTLVIGSFTEDAVKHITEMINYNTLAPAIEALNKVLNFQVDYQGENMPEGRVNIRTLFARDYGKQALKYLETLMQDMNGGVAQDQRKSLRDRALSMFKKNAVAGSLSVAAQQPLSYVRAAMMLSPRDMAQALMPQYYRGSWTEMMKHSGVAVIKEMGRFDMNFGQSARDFVSPDTSESLPERVVDKLNILPTLADRMTWTRMWSACKIEQHRLHPEMDMQSDAFLDLVGERFNDVMRRTQVYDSVLVKSSNMRSPNLGMKVLTSFMAEPTVSLNVLEDAVRNARDKGGMKLVGKAGATFLLSAVLQALIKGFMSAGRSPDDKKTAEENFLYKWQTAFMSEANPLGLIPGYSDLIEVLKNGELTDDAMSAVGKLKSVIDKAGKALSGQGQGVYRDLEDTAGQLAQMFTNVPAKNIMRDMRAMLTWFRQGSLIGAKDFANRESSDAVKRMQAEAGIYQGDNMLGVINTWLGEAGYKTTNKAYYGRMYSAMQAGDQKEADDIREYLTLGKGVKEEDIDSGLRSQAKADSSLGEAERSEWLIDQGLMSGTNTITTQLKKGKISAEEARKLMKQADPQMSDDDIWWKVDQISWQLETGAEETRGKNYRLMEAVGRNKSDEINKVVKEMMAHGVTQKQIKDYMGDLKQEYLAADSKEKVRIRDAIQKVYKAIGLTAAEADKRIKAWKPAKENTTSTKKKESSQDTTGQWGRGNINLNKRKVIHNNDGTISTEESFSTNIDGKEVLLPTIIDGKRVSEEKAIQHYMQTGEHLGKFDTVKEAEEYAQKLHERQDWYYHNH